MEKLSKGRKFTIAAVATAIAIVLSLISTRSIRPVQGTTETTLIVELYQTDTHEPIQGVPVTVLWGPPREDSEHYECGNTDELGVVIFDGFGDYEGEALIKANFPSAPCIIGYAEHITTIHRGSVEKETLYLDVKDFTGLVLGATSLTIAIAVIAVLLISRRKR